MRFVKSAGFHMGAKTDGLGWGSFDEAADAWLEELAAEVAAGSHTSKLAANTAHCECPRCFVPQPIDQVPSLVEVDIPTDCRPLQQLMGRIRLPRG